jgi:hypothetical protein
MRVVVRGSAKPVGMPAYLSDRGHMCGNGRTGGERRTTHVANEKTGGEWRRDPASGGCGESGQNLTCRIRNSISCFCVWHTIGI